jgi:hypothetical protein
LVEKKKPFSKIKRRINSKILDQDLFPVRGE